MSYQFEFRVLGPLEVVEAGRSLALAGKMSRVLLAILLLRPREAITADELLDDLWAERVPRTARTSLYNLIACLRRLLGPDVLCTTSAGYILQIDAGQLDSVRFEHLVARADSKTAREKVPILEAALGLWRGSPFVDVRYESFAQEEIRHLEEVHARALEGLLAAKLELGARDEVVPELQRLVHRFPFRERLRVQLMLALYRSGRSVDALTSYVDWRCTLMESWGIEPGREIRQLWDDICVQAPGLEGAIERLLRAAAA